MAKLIVYKTVKKDPQDASESLLGPLISQMKQLGYLPDDYELPPY